MPSRVIIPNTPEGHRVEGILLAAGLSTRMGTPKLLLEIAGRPLVSWVVQAALGSALDRVVIVEGASDCGLEAALGTIAEDLKVSRVVNPHPERGMSSSLIAGVSAVGADTAGALIMLADQPGLTSEVIDELVAAFQTDRSRIVVPSVRGRRTTPVLFPADLFPELLKTTGDVGGREVANRNTHRIVEIDMGSRYDDSDVDTPQDLRMLLSHRGPDKGRSQ